ncbi:multiple epidermal growth factor-like domains protein 11 [Gigantopelta aegis]|uniref:multiple epidermal growth factor-like domains protein 11 n=1 Tax=Gigantopelta aegis TaxID=1735272 RepID=UPI001B889C83|nr:multiple epidermal growth factor-like domains protein 11 [Gigantopelta aegis]
MCAFYFQTSACASGLWGQTCSYHCGHCNGSSCDRQSGNCQCETGWAPPRCTLCADFWYGENCNKTCNCRDRTEICNKRGGQCTACPDGWTGTACDQCVEGKYGEHCNQTCDNCRDKQCDRLTGSCLGGCAAGFTKPETGCTEKLESDTHDNKAATINTGLAIATGLAMALLVMGAIVSVWYFRRIKARQRHGERDSSKRNADHINDREYENVGAQHIDSGNEVDNVSNTGEPTPLGSHSTSAPTSDQNPQDGGIEGGYVNVVQDIQMNDYEKLDTSTHTTSQNVYEKITGI